MSEENLNYPCNHGTSKDLTETVVCTNKAWGGAPYVCGGSRFKEPECENVCKGCPGFAPNPNYKKKESHVMLYKHVFTGKDGSNKVKAIRFSLTKKQTKNYIVGIDINNEFLFEREDVTEILSFMEKIIRKKLTSEVVRKNNEQKKDDEQG